MADDDKSRGGSRPGRPVEAVRQRTKASTERPFDMWLQKQLHAMYDEIASEPLPNDLLNLIDGDAAKTGDNQDNRDKSGRGGKKA